WVWKDHLFAGVQRRHKSVVKHLLATGANGDLARLVVEAVLALELFDDRILEFGDAVDVRVFGSLAALDRLDCGLLDVVWGVEIGFAGSEPDNIAAGQFERARLVRDGDGRRRLDALELVRKKGHLTRQK